MGLFKKTIVLCAIIAFSAVPAFAFVDLIIAIVGSAIIHGAGALGLYYQETSGGHSVVDNNGNVIRPSQVSWVDLTMTTPAVQTHNVHDNMSADQIAAAAAANPSKYPLNQAAANPPNMSPAINHTNGSNSFNSTTIGTLASYLTNNGKLATDTPGTSCCGKTGGVTNCPGGSFSIYNNYPSAGYFSITQRYGDIADTCDTLQYNPDAGPGGTTRATNAAQALGMTGQVTPPANATTAIQAELDKMENDPNYTGTFTDDSTGLPYVPPAQTNVATPAQLAAYNAAGDQGAANTTALGSAQSAVTAANAAVTAAQAGVTAHPGDSGYANALAAAQAVAAVAQAVLDKLKKAIADAAAAAAGDSNETAPGGPAAYGDGTTKDFGARITAFTTAMKASSVFGTPARLIGSVPAGGTSSFNVSFGSIGSTVFDLNSFSSAISVMRFLCLFVCTVASIKILTLKGGSG
jgi:hypothetical protein